MFVVLAERGKSLTLTKLIFSMKYVLHFFLNEGSYFISEKWRSGVECMGQGTVGSVERLRKEKKT